MEGKDLYTRSVERALDILECFLAEEELALQEIANKTGLSPSTVLRIINSLQKRGYVSRDPESKKYRLGGTFQRFVNRIDRRNEQIRTAAGPAMEQLFQKYNENVQLLVLDGRFLLCMELRESTQEVRQILHSGDRRSLDRGAASRLFLAHTAPRQRAALARELDLDPDSLAEIPEDGYALSTDSNGSGIVSIAAPVWDAEGNMAAALTLSGPAFRFINKDMTEKIRSTQEAARDISQALRGQASGGNSQ